MATGMSARRDDAWQSSTSALPSTRVDLSSIAGRIEQRVLFGRITATEETRHSTRTVTFRPGATFAVVRGQASDIGAVNSTILIATAMPSVHPGYDPLLRVDSCPKVRQVLGRSGQGIGQLGRFFSKPGSLGFHSRSVRVVRPNQPPALFRSLYKAPYEQIGLEGPNFCQK